MKRTIQRDVEIRGQQLRAGEQLVLFYASANRDEDIFENPFEFHVDRNPNPHLGFGFGEQPVWAPTSRGAPRSRSSANS